jgi:hypothetical protein
LECTTPKRLLLVDSQPPVSPLFDDVTVTSTVDYPSSTNGISGRANSPLPTLLDSSIILEMKCDGCVYDDLDLTSLREIDPRQLFEYNAFFE